MRKFLSVLCSLALVAGTITPISVKPVFGADSVYDFDGDIIENPWGEIYTTEAPTEEITTKAPEDETEKVVIKQQPQNVSVVDGEAAAFSIVAEGTGLTYKWEYAGPTGTNWKVLSVKKSAFSITGRYGNNGFRYRCTVTDANGNSVTSNVAVLSVSVVDFKINSHPTDVTVDMGDMANFAVEAQGTGLTYLWEYQLSGSTTWKKMSVKTASFSLMGRAAFNGVTYRCTVRDVTGAKLVSQGAVMTVIGDALKITQQPTNVSVAVGTPITISIGAQGTGVTYLWQYMAPGSTTWKSVSSRTDSISMTANKIYNGYKYRCVLQDVTGAKLASNTISIGIYDPLVLVSQTTGVNVNIGDPITLAVEATGDGLTYTWQYHAPGATTWKTASIKTPTLSLNASATFNGYVYRCVVADSHGNKVVTDDMVLNIK